MHAEHPQPLVIGWREYVALPDWRIRRVRAKMDTGARTSAIHTGEIEELPGGRLRFEVVTRERPSRKTVWVEAEPIRHTTVKPSSGDRQRRPVVRTTLELGGVRSEIEVSLVCRRGMLCRMLLGRRALEHLFLVDSGRKYIVSQPPRRRKESS